MTPESLVFWLPVAVSFAGAAAGMMFWPRPAVLKGWLLGVSLASPALLLVLTGQPAGATAGLLLPVLLPVAAFLSLLGQPAHGDNRAAWIMSMLLLGLGLGALASQEGAELILLALVLISVGVLIHRYRAISVYHPWQGIGACGFGVLCVVVALTAAPPASAIAFLAVCAVLLPLPPLHAGYVAALAGLPGNLPAFLAVLLPCLGFHALRSALPGLPDAAEMALPVLGLAGALYGALKALAQPRVRSMLAYANLSFFSILWWYLASARTAPPQASVYVGAVGLATSGLMLAWYAVRARYGDVDLRAIRGLADPMPRFAVLVMLLALAALGLPPFGVFAGFMGLLLAPALPLSWGLAVVVVAWLAASWYILDFLQRLLFGAHRADLRYEDLHRTEFAALLALIVILLAMGVAPARLLDPGAPAPPAHVAAKDITWNR